MKNKEKINPGGAFYRILISFIALCIYYIPVSANTANEQISFPTKATINTVAGVLNYIEKNSDYIFIYQDAKIDLERKVTLPQSNQTVNEILNYLFTGTDVSYTIKNRQIAIYRNNTPKTEMKASPIVMQETKTIAGTVKDHFNEPITGVNVIIKGTTIGTTTDINGSYSLKNIPVEAKTIVFSFVGMTSQEITIGIQTIINVQMQEVAVALDDIVAIGYSSQKKESLTSAITSVNTEFLENRSLTKVATSLQGITPGVDIRQNSGRPGYGASTFNIRGASLGTFSSNDALVLIDGIVANIDDINPNDIEKISILKDAAAAAIYGSRATGGVVLITTKKGATGKVTVNYTGTYGIEVNPISSYKNKVIDTRTWMRANNEGNLNDGSEAIYSDQQIAQYDGTDPLKPATSQWFNWLKSSSPQQTHNVSLKGGNEKINAYASVGFIKQDGILYNDDYKKVNAQANLNWKPFSRLEFNFSAFYSKEDLTRPIGTVSANLLRPILNPPTDVFQYPNGVYNKGTLSFGGFNSVQAMRDGGNTLYDYDKYRLWGEVKFKIMEGLHLKYTLATNNIFNQENTFYNLMTKYDSDGNNLGYATPAGQSYSTAFEEWSTNKYLSNLVSLDYANKFGGHSVSAFVGFQAEQNRYDQINARGYRFVNNELREISASIGSGADLYGTTSAEEWNMASFIARAGYGYKDRYLVDVTMRYDGSSRFSSNKRWGFFPSISAAWRITEENFMKDLNWLSNLKARASLGQLGNQGKNLYPFATTISTETWAFGNTTSTIATVGTPADLNLSWETKTTVNIGLDFGFLKNQLTGSFDWYKDRTKDIIATPPIPTTFGASAPIQNTYVIDNNGWELELKWTDRIGKVTYYIGANLSDNRDKIVSMGALGTTDPRYNDGKIVLSPGVGTYYAEGKARNSLYLFETDGLFVDQAEIDNYVKPSTLTKPGDIKFIDRDNNGEINSDDRYLSDKTTSPHYIFGINLGAEFMGFDISAIFNGVGERWSYRNLDGHYMTGNRLSFNMFKENYNNRWSPENPNKHADQPRLTANNWISGDYSTMFTQPCEYHLRNMKYIRLKNLQIGYTLPKGLTNKIYMSKIRIYFTAENLFNIAPGYKEVLDPEAYWTTGETSSSVYYGPSKIISGGLSVTF